MVGSRLKYFFSPILFCHLLGAMDSCPLAASMALMAPGQEQIAPATALKLNEQRSFSSDLRCLLNRLNQAHQRTDGLCKVSKQYIEKHLNLLAQILKNPPSLNVPFFTCINILIKSPDPRIQTANWIADITLINNIFSAIKHLHLIGKPMPFAAIQYGINRFIILLGIAQTTQTPHDCAIDKETINLVTDIMAKPLKLSDEETVGMKRLADQLSKKLAEYQIFLDNNPSR